MLSSKNKLIPEYNEFTDNYNDYLDTYDLNYAIVSEMENDHIEKWFNYWNGEMYSF